jgi:hypothetical protein
LPFVGPVTTARANGDKATRKLTRGTGNFKGWGGRRGRRGGGRRQRELRRWRRPPLRRVEGDVAIDPLRPEGPASGGHAALSKSQGRAFGSSWLGFAQHLHFPRKLSFSAPGSRLPAPGAFPINIIYLNGFSVPFHLPFSAFSMYCPWPAVILFIRQKRLGLTANPRVGRRLDRVGEMTKQRVLRDEGNLCNGNNCHRCIRISRFVLFANRLESLQRKIILNSKLPLHSALASTNAKEKFLSTLK